MIKLFEIIKSQMNSDRDLEEKIFASILNLGIIVVGISAVVTFLENIGMFATITILLAALMFAITMVIYYGFHQTILARRMLCFLINCFLIPVIFFTCGGIDSGMPLYMMAGLFMIIPVLDGRDRVVCFVTSLIVDVCVIFLSYCMMDDGPEQLRIHSDILVKLSLGARVSDVIISLVLMSTFMCLTLAIALKAYRTERKGREDLLRKLEMLSKKDELTGLYNRRELFWHLETMKTFFGKRYFIAMFDVDHFKMINDTFGHLFGDVALKEIAKKMSDFCDRQEDEIAARFGGEEFVLFFKAMDDKEAFRKIDKLRKEIGQMQWEEHPGLSITISAGVSFCAHGKPLEETLGEADKQLYAAKRSGRNKVCMEKRTQ